VRKCRENGSDVIAQNFYGITEKLRKNLRMMEEGFQSLSAQTEGV
jgi:hypothetical protein